MKISKQTKKLAKEIIKVSTENKLVNEEKLNRFIHILVSSDDSLGLSILSEIERSLALYQRNQTLTIESAYPVESEQIEAIKQQFEKQTKAKLTPEVTVNKSLISGVKVTLGDNVWEHSVKNSLEQMKGNFEI